MQPDTMMGTAILLLVGSVSAGWRTAYCLGGDDSPLVSIFLNLNALWGNRDRGPSFSLPAPLAPFDLPIGVTLSRIDIQLWGSSTLSSPKGA